MCIRDRNVGQPVIMQAANSEAQEPTEDVMDDADVAGLAMGPVPVNQRSLRFLTVCCARPPVMSILTAIIYIDVYKRQE